MCRCGARAYVVDPQGQGQSQRQDWSWSQGGDCCAYVDGQSKARGGARLIAYTEMECMGI